MTRDGFYRRVSPLRDIGGTVVQDRSGGQYRVADGFTVKEFPPELHGSELLPGEDDEQKIQVCQEVAELVVEYKLRIYRVALRLDKAIWNQLESNTQRYLTPWLSLVHALETVLRTEAVVPIMDMGNPALQDALPVLMKRQDFLRAVGSADRADADFTRNFLGEVYFADSNHSVFVQAADIISYLLLQRDMVAAGWHASSFKKRLAGVAANLADALVHDAVSSLQIQGSTRLLLD